MQGGQGGKGIWTGPKSPNATKVKDNDPGCSSSPGCLFNIETDPTEHVDLAKAEPALMRNVTSAWLAAQAKAPYFQTNDVPGYPNCTTVAAFVQKHRGFGGPICYNGSIPFLR